MPAFGYKPTTVTKTGGDDKKVVTPVVPNAINKLIVQTPAITQMKMSLFTGNPYYKPGSLAAGGVGGVRNAGSKGRRT
jgi:hypothetical protein